jgi:hypothetical protein
MQIILTYPNTPTAIHQASVAIAALIDEYGEFDDSKTVVVKENLVTVLEATNAFSISRTYKV